MTTTKQRSTMKTMMNLLLAHRPQVHYEQLRPMQTIHEFKSLSDLTQHLKSGGTIACDCSETMTLICKLCGLKDPNNSNYDGYGNTETLYEHLPHYTDPSGAQVGALVEFGVPVNPLSNQHVTMVYETGKNPLLFSHGSSAGPIKILLSDYEKYVPSQKPTTFLNVAGL